PITSVVFVLPPSATPEISTLSLHDALPIFDAVIVDPVGVLDAVDTIGNGGGQRRATGSVRGHIEPLCMRFIAGRANFGRVHLGTDRKSTRLNSSHVKISYAVFCLKKKTKI